MKSGNLNFLEPSGPLQESNGTDLTRTHLNSKFWVFFPEFKFYLPYVIILTKPAGVSRVKNRCSSSSRHTEHDDVKTSNWKDLVCPQATVTGAKTNCRILQCKYRALTLFHPPFLLQFLGDLFRNVAPPSGGGRVGRRGLNPKFTPYRRTKGPTDRLTDLSVCMTGYQH